MYNFILGSVSNLILFMYHECIILMKSLFKSLLSYLLSLVIPASLLSNFSCTEVGYTCIEHFFSGKIKQFSGNET